MYCKESKYNGINFYRAPNSTLAEGPSRLLQFRVEQTLQVAKVVQLEHLYV
jgi:hypothetical protein